MARTSTARHLKAAPPPAPRKSPEPERHRGTFSRSSHFAIAIAPFFLYQLVGQFADYAARAGWPVVTYSPPFLFYQLMDRSLRYHAAILLLFTVATGAVVGLMYGLRRVEEWERRNLYR